MKIKIEFEDNSAYPEDNFVKVIKCLTEHLNELQKTKSEQNNENTNSSEY